MSGCTVKPCDPKDKKPCEPEEGKKCKEPKVKVIEEEPECVEPWAMKVEDRVLFDPKSKDPVVQERIKCLEDCHVKPIYEILTECNKRVTRKLLYTAETCHDETMDLMEALDKCVKSKAFNRLV